MFFDGNVTSASQGAEQEALNKALTAGYGTDSATYVNGRAMIPEDLESTTVNVVAQLKEDCKVFNGLKKEPVNSTVHEFNRRTQHGDYRFLSVAEGGSSAETDQALERKFLEMKYLQTRRSVTKQMEVVKTFEGALASEKLAGIETIVKGAEHQIFHGNSKVIPTEFDGLLAQIEESTNAYKHDARGASIGAMGETLFDEVARQVWERGGDLKKSFFPAVLAKDIKDLFADRSRYVLNNGVNTTGMGLPDHVTAIGSTIKLSGDAGADKFFQVKGKVTAQGDVNKRPATPSAFTASAGAVDGSKFAEADAGDYMYTVHAVNAYGISEGKNLAASATVAKGDGVTLTITGDSKTTGFIICRSKKGKTETMEMVQVGKAATGNTVYVDKNEDLPGTASMILLSEGRTSPILSFDQLLPCSTIPLYPTDKAETPFLIVLYGALENRAPEFCSVVKNIAYTGGF